jgi:hypothetical protein
MQQGRRAAEPRAHDAPVAEGRRHAVNHDTAAALTDDFNLKVESRSLAESNGNSRYALLVFTGRAPYRSAARTLCPRRESYGFDATCRINFLPAVLAQRQLPATKRAISFIRRGLL